MKKTDKLNMSRSDYICRATMRLRLPSMIAMIVIACCPGCAQERVANPVAAAPDRMDAISEQAITALVTGDADALQRLGLSAARARFVLRDYRTLAIEPASAIGEFVSAGPYRGGYSRVYRIAARDGRSIRVRCLLQDGTDGRPALAGLNLIEDPTSNPATTRISP